MEIHNGYLGVTDPDWYYYLSNQPRVDEANFWQPHGSRVFRAIKPGELFFFKLRAPLKMISGFGFFERYESLPAWLAWECFGEMNLIDELPRSATAHVLEDSTLLSLEKSRLRGLVINYPELSLGMLKGLSLRLRQANQKLNQ